MWNPSLYNEKHAFVYDYGEKLIELLNPDANERILDLGCGSGQLTHNIGQIAQEVVGIDSSKEMIEDAKSRYGEIEFQVADATNFSFEKKFDAIFSNATLHWVLDYQQAINCIYQNLLPNGRMVVEFGGKNNVKTIVSQLRKSLAEYGYEQQAKRQQWYFPSIGEYASELEAVGFRVAFAQHFDRPTELADEKSGIVDWLTMFGKGFFEGVLSENIERICQEVQEKIRPFCFKNGKWYADYKRIQFVAFKGI